MKLNEIRKQPTTTGEMIRDVGERDPRIHESVFRSFHIVDKIKELLKKGTPPDVLIEIIEDLQNSSSRYEEVGPECPSDF